MLTSRALAGVLIAGALTPVLLFALPGMLSQLPAEVDVEGHVKHVLLNIRRDGAGNSMRGGSIMVGHASTAGGIPPNSSVLLMNQVRNEDDNV